MTNRWSVYMIDYFLLKLLLCKLEGSNRLGNVELSIYTFSENVYFSRLKVLNVWM